VLEHPKQMIEIDGSYGEGGGQIIRTALALSTITQKPFHATNIRKGRPEPGLKPQHLYCIKALEKLSACKAEGAQIGSTELTFHPAEITGTRASINIGTAGSVTLLLQAVLLPCIFAKKPITLTITGGTDTEWATPIDYFRFVLLPKLQKFANIELKLIKRGYYPKGGGEIEVSITPKSRQAEPYALENAPKPKKILGIVHSSKGLEKNHVAERIAQGAHQLLSKHVDEISIKKEYSETDSTGCGITLWIENSAIGSDMLGERKTRAEDVGKMAAEKLLNEITHNAVVDIHTADAFIPFLALSKGTIKTSAITPHVETNIYAVESFLGKSFFIDKAKGTIKSS
jgi:RNA 3'-phosphate cyclase